MLPRVTKAEGSIFFHDFETGSISDLASGWSYGDRNPASGLVYWKEVNWTSVLGGTKSLWCAGYGGNLSKHLYANNMEAYVNRTFDLTHLQGASLRFKYKIGSVEPSSTQDFGLLKINGKGGLFFLYKTGWTPYTVDLTPYCGGTVTIEWVWFTDTNGVFEGMYLDDIEIVDLTTLGAPDASKITVNQNPPGKPDSVQGSAGAVESPSTVKVYSNSSLTSLIGQVASNSDGSFSAIQIGDNEYSKVWISATNKDGVQSRATQMNNDISSPTTSVTLSPASSNGQNGWYITNPRVSFSTNESSTTYYRIDSGTTETYSAPFQVSEGEHMIYFQSADRAGNVESVKNFNVKVDTIKPAIWLAGVTDGSIYNTSVTPVIEASDANLDSTDFKLDGIPFTSGTVVSSDGIHTLVLLATDKAGNQADTVIINFIINKLAPNPPILDQMTSPTKNTSLSISGLAEANSTVKIYDGKILIETVTANSQGTFSSNVVLAEGTHLISAKAIDGDGNESGSSNVITLVIDTTPPAPPTLNQPVSPTNNTSITLTGTAEASSTVKIYEAANLLGSATANAQGTFSLNLILSEGTHVLTTTATDQAGNQSVQGNQVTAVVDLTAPTISSFTINSGATYTNNANVTLNIQASGSPTKMRFANSETDLPSAVWIDFNSSCTYTLPSGDGTKTVYAQIKDDAGNISTSSPDTIILDTTIPQAPTPSQKGGSYSADVTVTLSAESGATIYYTTDGSDPNTLSNKYTSPITLTSTTTLKAIAVDQAGNISSVTSETYTITKVTTPPDTTAPSAPTLTQPTSPTNNTSITLTGTAEASSTVKIYEAANLLGSATANAQGTFSLNLILSEGTHVLTAKATDAAGNESALSNSMAVTVDLTAPIVSSFSINSGDSQTNKTAVSLNVSTSGSPIKMRLAETQSDLYYANWENFSTAISYTFPPGDGQKKIWIQLIDEAGNLSTAASDTIILDTVAPLLHVSCPPEYPLLYKISVPVVQLVGWTEPGASILINGQPEALSVTGGRAHFDTTGVLSQGSNTFKIVARDAAGNEVEDTRTAVYDPNLKVSDSITSDQITPGEATIVTLPDGTLEIEIPLGVYNVTIKIKIVPKKIATYLKDQGLSTLSSYDVTPLNAANNSEISNLRKDVTLSFRYEDKELKERKINENKLWVFYQADGSSNWTPEDDVKIDKKNNNVTCRVKHFSKYALMADVKAPTLTLKSPKNNSTFKKGKKIKIAPVVRDKGVGMRDVKFFLDNKPKFTDKKTPYTWTLDTRKLKGKHTLKIIATDKLKNTSSVVRRFKVK